MDPKSKEIKGEIVWVKDCIPKAEKINNNTFKITTYVKGDKVADKPKTGRIYTMSIYTEDSDNQSSQIWVDHINNTGIKTKYKLS
jgi:hypothetical protein